MMYGTTLPFVKAALVAKLQERFGSTDVAVGYQAVTDGRDLSNDAGQLDAIWLHTAEALIDVVVFKALPLLFDESYDLAVVVQSIRPLSDGSQQAADLRCAEMLADVVGILASDPTLGITDFPRCEAIPAGWEHVPGALKAGHGARFELTVHVEARLQLS